MCDTLQRQGLTFHSRLANKGKDHGISFSFFFFFFNPKLHLFREDVELFLPECSILLIVGINLLSGTPPLHEEAPLQVVWNYTDVFSQFLLGEKFNSQILSAFSLIWPLAFTRLLIFMKYAVYFYFKTTTTL